MRSLCLAIARFSPAAWVGAATLFIVASIREVRASELDSTTRSILAAVRFPAYYAFGFSLTIAALLCGLIVCCSPDISRWRVRGYLSLIVGALVLMTIDYIFIYGPLAAMVARPAAARPASFTGYHTASMWINAAVLAFSAAAAFVMAWPQSSAKPSRAE